MLRRPQTHYFFDALRATDKMKFTSIVTGWRQKTKRDRSTTVRLYGYIPLEVSEEIWDFLWPQSGELT